jgi:hypothetical protein
MKNLLFTALIINLMVSMVEGQNRDIINRKEGSYLYYGQPHIEDNSMLIDEAFNQTHRNLQHITNVSFSKNTATYSYALEIPLKNEKHQLSFSFNYGSIKKQDITTGYNLMENGVGDASLSYRPLLFGKDWQAMVIPRFTLIIPSGNAQKGLGSGGWGSEFGIAITKRIIPAVVTNYNVSYTWICKADYYTKAADGNSPVKTELNCASKSFGMSAIWLLKPHLNLMLEYLITSGTSGNANTVINNSIINPGFRFAVDAGNVQIVPGVGIPLNFTGNRFSDAGCFIYLSIEHPY